MPEVYTHGHHESVLRSHRWRTAENSAAYLLPHLKPHMRVLDIGCGPGTITAGLAGYVPDGHVTGIDAAPDIVEQARELTAGRENIDFTTGDHHHGSTYLTFMQTYKSPSGKINWRETQQCVGP